MHIARHRRSDVGAQGEIGGKADSAKSGPPWSCVGWEVIFSELGFAGSGARKPRREFEGSALKPFFHVFLRLNQALIV